MAEPYVVGIDFGAVNIKACAWDGRKYRMIALDSHDTESVATENVILYKMANGVPDPRIGMSARQGRYEDGVDAQDFVRDIKRKLEQRAWTQEIPCLGKELSAEEVATDILRLVYRRVEAPKERGGRGGDDSCRYHGARRIFRCAARAHPAGRANSWLRRSACIDGTIRRLVLAKEAHPDG